MGDDVEVLYRKLALSTYEKGNLVTKNQQTAYENILEQNLEQTSRTRLRQNEE